MIQLIAFLGNYGREYAATRHNTAWQFAESLPYSDRLSWQRKFKGQFAALSAAEFMQIAAPERSLSANAPDRLFFLKPETYMNLSGEAIGEAAQFYKIQPDGILVVHDELELPLGTVSLKWSGGLGGHNGLRSAKAQLGTADFWRLRFGIGRPEHRNIADYVLAPFTEEERIVLSQVFPQAAQLFAKVLLASDPARLLSEWSKKKLAL